MIRTLVVEDELNIRQEIISIIKELDDRLLIVGDCGTVEEALVLARNCKPDLMLLDINLSDGTSFDFLNKLEDRNFNIVFVTAHEEYAIKAIKAGALDYVLKPVDEDILKEVIGKVVSSQQNNHLSERIDVANKELEGKSNRIVLRLHDSYQIVRFDELVYCKSDGGYTTFFLTDNRKFMVSKSIKEYERILPSNQFFRTHQSYLVNLEFVDKYEKGGGLYLKGNIAIPVAVRKKDDLLKRLL